MFPQEWTPYGIFGYRRRWHFARRGGMWLAVALSLGLWALFIAIAVGMVQ